MSVRRKLKIRPILITINIAVILIIIAFYGLRMYKFYKAENAVVENTGNTTFTTILQNKQSLVDKSIGLVYDEKTNTYTYVGKSEDNYVLYSGILFRIVGIDTSSNIKLVSEKNLTLMYSGLDKGFDESYINKWLSKTEEVEHSGVFESVLYNKDELLTTTTACNDIISDLTKVTCDEQGYESLYSLLSLYDYVNAGSKDSYLNNGETYYLNTFNDKNQNYYVLNTGEIGSDIVSTKIHGVRPVITINASAKLLSGDGKINNPYIIEAHDIDTLNDVYVGNIISYSNLNWKVIEKDEISIRVALTEPIKNGEEFLAKTFGGGSNAYSTNKNTIGNYLNNTFYSSLEDKENIVSSKWFTGGNTLSNLDYTAKYARSFDSNIGMLALGDMFVGDVANTLTITPGMESSTIIMVINDKYITFGDFVATLYNIRPALNLKSELKVYEGSGTLEDPYTIKEKIEVSEISEISEISGE